MNNGVEKQSQKKLFKSSKWECPERRNRRWSLNILIKRLQSITKVEQLIDDIVIKTSISKLDIEEKEILKLLNINL